MNKKKSLTIYCVYVAHWLGTLYVKKTWSKKMLSAASAALDSTPLSQNVKNVLIELLYKFSLHLGSGWCKK